MPPITQKPIATAHPANVAIGIYFKYGPDQRIRDEFAAKFSIVERLVKFCQNVIAKLLRVQDSISAIIG